MGATNVVLEGPSDQFLIAELNRLFVMYRDPTSFLDLTSVVLMSAESASGVEKLIAASQWGDERIPATVVLFDADGEGCEQKKRITGTSGRKGDKQLIDGEFVVTIGEALGAGYNGHGIVTTEDLIPASLYAESVKQFLETWYPDVLARPGVKAAITAMLDDPSYGKSGLVGATEAIFKQHVHPGRETYDKMGVFHKVVAITEHRLREGTKSVSDEAIVQMEHRLKALCEELWRRIDRSRQKCQRESAAHAVRREINDFFKRFKISAPAFDVVRILERLGREVREIGEDGGRLRDVLTELLREIQQFRDGGNTLVDAGYWRRWSTALWKIRENPLQPDVTKFAQLHVDDATFPPAAGIEQLVGIDIAGAAAAGDSAPSPGSAGGAVAKT